MLSLICVEEECMEALSNTYLQDKVEDRWWWRMTSDKGYTVSGAYQMLI